MKSRKRGSDGGCRFYRSIWDCGRKMEYGLCSLSNNLVLHENCDYKTCKIRERLYGDN